MWCSAYAQTAARRLGRECVRVTSEDNKQWIWLAIDAHSREIIGVVIGDRSGQSAKKLWQSLPAVYRQCAVCYTDF